MSYKVGTGNTIRWYKDESEILHRENGPAVEYNDGSGYYFLNDKLISRMSPDGRISSDEEMLIALKLISFI